MDGKSWQGGGGFNSKDAIKIRLERAGKVVGE